MFVRKLRVKLLLNPTIFSSAVPVGVEQILEVQVPQNLLRKVTDPEKLYLLYQFCNRAIFFNMGQGTDGCCGDKRI